MATDEQTNLTVRITQSEFRASERLERRCRLPDGTHDEARIEAGMRRIFGDELIDLVMAAGKGGVRMIVKRGRS
jgi:hypothetical protein